MITKIFAVLEITLFLVAAGTAALSGMTLLEGLKFTFLIGGFLMFGLWVFYRIYTKRLKPGSFYDDAIKGRHRW